MMIGSGQLVRFRKQGRLDTNPTTSLLNPHHPVFLFSQLPNATSNEDDQKKKDLIHLASLTMIHSH